MARGLTIKIGADATELNKGLKSAKMTVSGFAGQIAKLVGVGAAFVGLGMGIKSLGDQFRDALQISRDAEVAEIRIQGLVGSLKETTDLLSDVEALAAATPFETENLKTVTANLLAAGTATEDVVSQLTMLANVAKNDQQFLELGDALAKGMAKGKFQLEDLNKFLERGINLLPALEAQTGKYGTALTKAISAGEISPDIMLKALSSLSEEGGAFFGMAERLAKSSPGLISTLTSNVDQLKDAFASPIDDAFKPILVDAIGLVQDLKDDAADLGEEIAGGIGVVYEAMRSGQGFELAGLGLQVGFQKALEFLTDGLISVASVFSEVWNGVEFSTMFEGVAVGLQAALLDAFDPVLTFLEAGVISIKNRLIQELKTEAGMAIAEPLTGIAGALSPGLTKEDYQSALAMEAASARESVEPFSSILGRLQGQERLGPGGMRLDDMRARASELFDQSINNDKFKGVADGLKGVLGDNGDAKIRFDALVEDLRTSWEETMEDMKVSFSGRESPPGENEEGGLMPDSRSALNEVVSSLAKVGGSLGYSGGNAMVSAQDRTNTLLEQTNAKLDNIANRFPKTGANQAVYS